MKDYQWNKDKNSQLRIRHGVCFDDMVPLLNKNERVLDIIRHLNQKKYPNQKMFVVEVGGYAYLVPYVEDDEKIFLKTIIPSRKATKKYITKR
ncbi:MAG: BrnT family toxin [Parcubacteria group bacterium]|nr:BrnT family toxin [Parcubacteria group bacterium]